MRLRILVVSIAVLLGLPAVFGQSADLQKDSLVLAALNGSWRFHPGDDAAWASPAFNDSTWSLIRASDGWASQGYKRYAGVGWYRIAVTLPAQHGPLAFYVTECDVSCQYFANGQLIGSKGDLPPHLQQVTGYRSVYTIPESLTRASTLVLAVRVWAPIRGGGSIGGMVESQLGAVGPTRTIQRLEGYELAWENTLTTIEVFGNLIAGLASMVLFLLRRKEREYLWFGLFLLVWSAFNVLQTCTLFYALPLFPSTICLDLLFGAGLYLPFEFYLSFFKLRRNAVYIVGAFSSIAMTVSHIANASMPSYGWSMSIRGSGIAMWACILLMLGRAWRTRGSEALALLIPESFRFIDFCLTLLAASGLATQHSFVMRFHNYYNNGVRWPFPIDGSQFVGDLTNLVVLILLIRRYALSRQDEERFESELEAARTVQSVLVPAETPSIAGFEIEAVYFPAGQVGGDFFQIIATPGGGALVTIGDVSGKGMPAAMTVSLLVGTLRTLAHYTQSPGEILAAMNQRMMSRSAGGFTTCLVLRVDPGGELIAANAGHVPAYVGGHELALENGLPLGLLDGATYRESRINIDQGQAITLVTDGVPEARNSHKELFGFERTASVSNESANAIAQTALSFGQEDDVTVVRLTYKPGSAHNAAAALAL
jgi:sigma-B regulation protein RsbU (phosphoserine phosphatase)